MTRRPLCTISAFVALTLAACGDRGTPVTTDPTPVPVPSDPLLLASLTCQGNTAARTVRCDQGGVPSGARGYIIVGGQGTYVQLTSSNVVYNSGTQVFSFNVTVQNLIPQKMGTTDGTTADGSGVRVIFHSGPTLTGGSGSVSVANASGTGAFTAAGQPYFAYTTELGPDGILSPNETSATKSWQLNASPNITFTFQLYVVAEVPFPNGYIDVTPNSKSLFAGSSQALTATVRSAVGNPIAGQTVTWGTGDGSVATVDGSGNVSGVAPGTVTITATSGARSGTASISVCPNLAVGAVYVADMPAGSSFCLGGAGEYTVVPVNLHETSNVSLTVTGSGIVPVTGPPSPNRLPARPRFSVRPGPRPDDAFERRLREMSRRELTPLLRTLDRSAGVRTAAGPRRAITPGVPAVGALMTLNVETDNSCSTFDNRVGRVVAVGTRIIVMADTMNPAGGLSAADYQAVADSFDTFVYPTVTANFGAPADIDGNGGRVIAFYTRAVNELTPPASSSFIGGFFFSRDLYTATECPTSNLGEMFYMLAADTSGVVNGNKRSVEFILDHTVGTLAHEFEHLINASRRLYVNSAPDFEEPWLDEGLAHISEELVFFNRAGLAPGANVDAGDLGSSVVLDAFFTYEEPNFGRLRQWLLAPHGSGPFQLDTDLATRGASYAFLRYAADRKGGTQSATWNALVNSTTTGLPNLQNVLGTDPLPWYRDFAAAMYIDDAAGSPPTVYTQPSWNFRNLYANLDYDGGPACTCAYELAVRNPSNGVGDTFTLANGGAAAYLRMGVSSGAFAGVTVLSSGVPPGSTVRVAVVRRE
ncbi:MAG TPA: Ig-like domain-containing protein [Longimicrobiaceae bacterium]|nr:Ig-like domain-containing protein [Longimicrobiaceae bacterium]